MMVHMDTPEKTNNDHLRDLVAASGLTQAVALTVFNRGLGPRGYSESAWKAFLADKDAVRFRALSDELLAHARRQFANVRSRG